MRAIITFHGIQPEPSELTVNREELASILDAARANDYAIKTLDEVLAAAPDDKVVALTFDNAFQSVKHAAEVLADFQAPATLFVVTAWVGKSNQWPGQPHAKAMQRLLRWEDLAALKAAGWDIQAQSHNHPDLRQVPDNQVIRELDTCKAVLAERLGVTPRVFAYPYGAVNRRVYELVKTRFDAAVTSVLSELPAVYNRHLVPRLDAQYLWPTPVHFYFGRRRFWLYLQARQQVRRWQSHRGEPLIDEVLNGV